ncbi:MAG: inositol monophosphatase [Jatrophihabitantaceae bacterium]|nr:inositol monophosphatase [Jatrophihabitantaceae bacterium]
MTTADPHPATPSEPRSETRELASELAHLAVRIAQGAGEVVRSGRSEAVAGGSGFATETKSSASDLVTAVDKASERYIVAQLRAARPGDGLRGEEGTDEAGTTGVRWVIDPIDGTVNFVLGLPHYSVSIAAQLDGTTIAACVLDGASGDFYWAALGGGAWRRDVRLHGPRSVPVAEMVVGTGFTYQAHERARQGEVLAAVLPEIANLRRLGSAALDLCLVAAGQLDAFYEFGINEWDVAAGLLVAKEAGVALSGLRGRPAAAPFVAAAGPAHAAGFFALLERAGADLVA